MAEVFPVSTGHPEYSGTLIPEIWSPRLLMKFYTATVFGSIANVDHEDEIQGMGDTVHIRTTPDIVISEYKMGMKLEYQTPEPSVVDLLIDKGKYYATRLDDVARVQADYNALDDWTNDAGQQMKIAIDLGILADVYADADANNYGATAGAISSSFNMGAVGTPLVITRDNVVDFIQDASSVLSEQDVPDDSNRWIVLPEWACNLIGKSDLKDASLSGDSTSIARNGRVGLIGNIEVYRSNQLARTTDGAFTTDEVIFGHVAALTFASQLVENRGPFEHPDYFGTFVKGLQVYGYKVQKPEAMGWAHIRKGT